MKQIKMKQFKLTEEDKTLLLEWGYKETEFWQIEDATNEGDFISSKERKLSWQTAIKRLGRETFLSGICRASFHWSAMRGEGDNQVYFDFGRFFK